MKPTKLLLIAMIALIAVGTGLVSTSDYVQASQQLGSTSSPYATGSPIIRDQYTINGTMGTNLCDRINQGRISADQRGVNAGQIHVSFSANVSVNFWILSQSQYNTWLYNGTTCSSRLETPSILTVASRSNYDNSTIQIPTTDIYYFVFDNSNPGPVLVKFEVDYIATTTSTPTSDVILNTRFNLNGIGGGNFRCIYNDYYHAMISAGQLSVSYSSTGGVVDFWILNSRQHSEWVSGANCLGFEKAPSLYTAIAAYGYNGEVQINSTDTYYFAFANFNQGNVSITLSVSYSNQKTEKVATSPDIRSLLSNPAQIGNYWQQLLGGAATGVSVVLGWLFKTRKRRFLTSYMAKIDSTYNEYAVNRDECQARLEKMSTDIVTMLKTGKIDESHFTILEDKITHYQKELK
jgi:hypothetical protein